MPIQILISGLLLGTVSSFHCVGMCGPLSLALPLGNLTKLQRSLSLLLYHAGRILTYGMFGLIFGLAGRQIYLAGFQRWFSIVLGIVVLLLTVQYFFYRNSFQPSFLKRAYQKLQQWIIVLWKNTSRSGFFLLGIANGMLPCGMVYLAVAGALSFSKVDESVLFMILFGLGTLPALLMVIYFKSFITISVRSRMRKAIPYLMALMGVILILRGLNLGIPFISPVLDSSRAAIICH